MFTVQQIQNILGIVDYHSAFLVVTVLGKENLTEYDKFILKQKGVDIEKIMEGKIPTYYQSLMWGRLSTLLQEKDAQNITYDDFYQYIKRGQYIPLNATETRSYEIAKQKTYEHIKGFGTKIRQDVNNILSDEIVEKRKEYEKVVHDEIARGVAERRSTKAIISDLGNKLDTWNYDWGRMVETETNNVFQLGRAQTIASERGEDSLVFKNVYDGACRHCIKLFLTNGIGSQPKIFKLSELEANGDNIGVNVSNWKPTLTSVHPHSITDKKTAILTDEGWKMIIDVNIGDKVLTHKGRYRKVTDVLKDYPIDLIKEENKLVYNVYYKHKSRKDPDDIVKLSLTGDHKVLTQRGWVQVKDLSCKDKMIKLLKKCVICNNYLESYDYSDKSCCSKECSIKFRTQNAFNLWKNRSEEELDDLKNKISNTVTQNWEDGVHKNTLIHLKSKERREKTSDRMLNGGAIKALEVQGGNITSKIQMKLFKMVKSLFEDVELEYKIFNKSLDIAIPKYKIDIEFDGSFWHKNRIDSDNKRDELLKNNGWHVLRYEDKLPKLGRLRGDIENIIQNDDHHFIFEETDIVFIKRNYTPKGTLLYDLTVEEDESFIARGVVIHNCRCLTRYLPSGYVWDEDKNEFVISDEPYKRKVERKSKIKITVNDKEYFI